MEFNFAELSSDRSKIQWAAFFTYVVGWLVGRCYRLVGGWLIGSKLAGWIIGWLYDCQVGCLVGWIIDWLVGQLVG